MARSIGVGWLVGLAVVSAASAQSDREGSKDYPGISRMPGYYIDVYKESQFDSANFPVTKGGKTEDQAVEGRLIVIQYVVREKATPASMLQVARNHQNAAKTSGGQVMSDLAGDNWRTTTLRLVRNEKEAWVLVEARSESYSLTIVEKQAMQQDVTMDASAMAEGLASSGKVSLYGIFFDTGKSDLKPESDPTIGEIANLLKKTPSLKIFVVGHTDIVGDTQANIRLSQARAQSVIAALTSKYGIAEARLIPFGNGPCAPMATNATEEGRARNRRVDLVELAR